MKLTTIRVAVKLKGDEIYHQVNVKFDPEKYQEAEDKEKFIKNLASKSFLGSKIESIEYNYN